MDLGVVGRHALLFDDDAMAAFVNSKDALVEWNSLLIDRYDVRHLLSAPPLPRRLRIPQQSQSSSSSPPFSSLEEERYLDLPPPSPPPSEDIPDSNEDAGLADAGSYRAVAFSYENVDSSSEKKNADTELESTGFRPSFPVPGSLMLSLPPTEKIHQIIARTAMFVSKNGGQSEIVLRVKQGNNPSFGFLMPDHHLHSYYRFLVDHQHLLQSDVNGKFQNEQKTDHESNTRDGTGGGALSLLGAVYGSGEDEDGAAESALESKENVPTETANAASSAVSYAGAKATQNVGKLSKDTTIGKHLHSEENILALKTSSLLCTSNSGKTSKNDTSSLVSHKSQDSSHAMKSKIEPVVSEPPSDMKRLVDKIVEFILKNGKQFEATLIEQDIKHGRFPFLLPSNQYHSYYLRVLQKAQESKVTGKNFVSGTSDSVGHVPDKKNFVGKEIDNVSMGSAGCDIPYDSDRKEKFKMVIGKSKKEGMDPPSKATQQQFAVRVDAAAAAAILQAATRGIKNPNLGFLSSTSVNGNRPGRSSEGGHASSSLHLSQHLTANQKPDQNVEQSVSVPVAKALARTAALEAASEADSSEAHLTKEQKLKAVRLKRAKMFVSMLKSGATPLKGEHSGGLSAEQKLSGVFGSGAEVNFVAKEREGSSVPLDVDNADKLELSERKHSGDEYNERRSRRKYRSRRHGKPEEDDEEKEHKSSRKKHRSNPSSLEYEKEEENDEERDDKHSRKKHRSRHLSSEDEQEKYEHDRRHQKHSSRRHHCSSHEDNDDDEREQVDKHSSRRHQSHKSLRDEDEVEVRHKPSRRKHRSRHSSHHSRERHKHRKRHSSSKDQESQQNKHNSFVENENQVIKGSRSEREEELEEGEISSKLSNQSRESRGNVLSRETSVDLSSSCQLQRAPSQPSETTEVSDDLRAKIRAMLMGIV